MNRSVISSEALKRLATAAELCLERELMARHRIDEAVAVLHLEITELHAARVNETEHLAFRGAVAHVASQWEGLRERRIVELQGRLAELAADREEVRARIARACGRLIAIRKLSGPTGR